MEKKKSIIITSSFILFILFPSCSSLFSAKKTSNDPAGSRLVSYDIDNFYRAFDLAVNDTANAEVIFEDHYFTKGSKGLRDFYKIKIRSTEKFSAFVLRFKDYYQDIRRDVLDLGDLEDQIFQNFQKFEELYPKAVYPDVYFLIGNYQSNGTISKKGLLIGTEILARTANSDTSSWNKDMLRISMRREHIPVTVSHELVHFNQEKMKGGNTLLWKSIREGSAEFISELISGKTDADFEDFKGLELKIWEDFQKEKNKRIWSSWQRESDLRPKNAGYWAGYMICKAYYKQVGSKEIAVNDILNIKDYEDFYQRSKVDTYIEEKYEMSTDLKQ